MTVDKRQDADLKLIKNELSRAVKRLEVLEEGMHDMRKKMAESEMEALATKESLQDLAARMGRLSLGGAP